MENKEENKEKNLLKYGVIYLMIKDLLNDKSISLQVAERLNQKCADNLKCKSLSLK